MSIREVMTTQEAVAYTGLTRQTLTEWRKAGKVRARKFAGRWFWWRDSLDEAYPPEVREARKHA